MHDGRPPVRPILRQAIDILGPNTTNGAVRNWILSDYPETNVSTINARIITRTVNHPSRVHYPQDARPHLATDPRYDFHYRSRSGIVELSDESRHSRWEIRSHTTGDFIAHPVDGLIRAGPQPDETLGAAATHPLATAARVSAVTSLGAHHGATTGRRSSTSALVEVRIQTLCRDFQKYVTAYDRDPPFRRHGQWE